MEEIKIEAQSDYLEKITRTKPINALAEVIWNSLDADAKNVMVRFIGTDIGTDKIEITDDGSGFDYDTAKQTFSSLGGSWKRNKAFTFEGRRLHGKEGHGRFKIFSLGHNVVWKVVFNKQGKCFEYSISGGSGNLNKFSISDVDEVGLRRTGVTVVVTDPVKQYKIFDEDVAADELSSIYAPYLSSYPAINIIIGNKRIDMEGKIKNRIEFELKNTIKSESEADYSFKLDLFEWNGFGIRELFFCDEAGFPLVKYEKQIRGVGEYNYTGYVKSSYFSNIKENGNIDTIELDSELVPLITEAIRTIKGFFIDRYREDQKSILDQWKAEKVYPYTERYGKTAVDEAEEKVFDILALNLNEYIEDFGESSTKQKKLQLKLLQQAIETNPDNIRKIIEEVLSLPQDKADELAELLECTSLSSIISTSKLIADRLMFITGFENIVFDTELKEHLKERSQLHRILADNSWFFGDEFSLSVDDMSLTEVLRKYSEKLSTDILIDSPVLRLDGTVGIIDLMLSKAVPKNHANESEYLVIELKAPKVKIGQTEMNQIESYAFAVANDERFRGIKTRWEFWVISDDMDPIAKMKANQRNFPKGVIFQNNEPEINDITIKVKTWSEIIADNKHRYNFVKDRLNLSISNNDGLSYLHEKYAKYINPIQS